jgi:hypothetical protein
MNAGSAADTVTRMLHAVDAKDWPGVRREFTATVDVDYRSLFGDPAARVDADALVGGWRQFAGSVDVTQHVTGPIVVSATGNDATARTHVRAYHRVQGASGGDIWMVAGHYTISLVVTDGDWKIAGITLTVLYQEGNLRIPEIARQRR